MDEDGTAPAADWSAAGSQRWNRGWRRAALASGMLVYPVVTAYWASQDTHGGAEVAAFAIIAAFCGCYVAACALVVRESSHRLLGITAGVMVLLFLAELPFARADAFYLCAVVVSSAALIKRGAGLVIGAGVLAGLLVPWAVRPWHSGPG